MTYNGAAGTTKTAMAKTLGIASLSDDDLSEGYRRLFATIRNADDAVQLDIANALWVQSGFPIRQRFLDLSRESYGANDENVNFAHDPKAAAQTINAWTDKNTHGKISKIVGDLDRATRLVLTDAVYFKGRWSRPFDRKATETRRFSLRTGGSTMIPMMVQGGEYFYLETAALQAISLPYGSGRFEMYIFLPRKSPSASTYQSAMFAFLHSLDSAHWIGWLSRMRREDGKIILPKFKLTYGKSLRDTLTSMGMGIAFDPQRADFSGITSEPAKMWISFVEHSTYMKVDEEGTEAAAATAGGMSATVVGLPTPKPFEMVVDHPFFCAIADHNSGYLLFAAIISDPTAD
jgi:serine protease inhibitor